MIKGIGVDIVKLSRIKISNLSFLSKAEIKIFNSISDANKISFLAGRWAAKEAIFKAWDKAPNDFRKIEIFNDKNGKPYLKDKNNILISISHGQDYAIAFAINELN